ncbi:MAG: ATP-dependent zinc metalloprotease FtsH [Chloroflexi bacterium]|nr:ATP-dependent zinc metalloprotease FtsH [Chloroflexota bacterium]NOG66256.1 ATP-dependent zinc metalloprotease FtsH [Chloroflexota bacterium]GIK40628.1 MAG: ATP-dependent zinc metalloprotease FtsH [Chloroflexota bacterium]
MKWSRALYAVLILVVLAFLYGVFVLRAETRDAVELSKVAELANKGQVDTVIVDQNELVIKLRNGSEVSSTKEPEIGIVETLRILGVSEENLSKIKVSVAPRSAWDGWLTILGTLLPLILIGGFFFFILRQAQGAGNQALNFGKSRARMFTGDKPTVTFDDVAGVDEAKQELAEIVEFLREPEKFISLGARIPKGVLMVGPPGCGKTLTAKAISGEAGVPFFSISGSEFVEMFVGVGASRVRDLFDQAKRNSPCIIFMDEIDAVGRHRGAGLGGSHDEREQTLNQILVEMDGFDTDTNVIVVAATNRPDILDPALLRPGRFDRRVVLDRPDRKGREQILGIHVKGKPLASNVELQVVAKQTPGFVGADLENLVNEAAILAARRNKKQISMLEFQEAIEKVIAGPERKSRIIPEKERNIIAHHEAGHALVMKLIPECDPVHKVSIIARGMAGGYTLSMPVDDRYLKNQSKFEADLAALMGGRVAEEVIFDEITTGASNDLDRATKMARAMVTQYGMSQKLGPLIFGEKDELVFLGKEIGEQRNYSEEIARQIDHEVRRIVETAYNRATQLIQENKAKLEEIAQRLLKEETLDSQTFEAMFA